MKFKWKRKVKTNDNNKEENVVIKYLKCYKEILFRKQIVLFILCLVIFLVAFTIGMSTIDFNAPLKKDINAIANINLIQMQFIFVMVLTPFLALVPFIKKLSVITIFYSYFMAFNVVNMFYLPTCNNILLAISVILSLLALSLNIVLSFELSEKVNNRFVKSLSCKNNSNKNNKNDKEANIDNIIPKEEKYLNLKRSVIIVTFVICMILSIVNLIVTKFI